MAHSKNELREPIMMTDSHAAMSSAPPPTPLSSAICPYELSSLHSQASYVAQDRGMPLDLVELMVAVRFGVADLSRMPREDFRTAIAFLSNLRPTTRSAK
jgi:hypothetical protein